MSIRILGKFFVFGERAFIYPLEQGFAQVNDGSDLWVVDVGVDQPGDEDAVAQIDDLGCRVGCGRGVDIGAGDDFAVVHNKGNVSIGAERSAGKGVGWGIEYTSTVDVHGVSLSSLGVSVRPCVVAVRPRR